MKNNNFNSAYSIVELAITILIISIIIGLTISSNRLVYNNKLRKIHSEFTIYDRAVKEFSFQYNQLPGDLPSHMNFWVDSNYGNGDGYINWFDEGYYAWQHLVKAELINGNFTGSTNSNYDAIADSNVPSTHLANILWSAFGSFAYNKHSLYLGKATNVKTRRIAEDSLNPHTIFYLEQKFDDKYPETGSLRIDAGLSNNNCVENISAQPKLYKKSSKIASCDPYFILN